MPKFQSLLFGANAARASRLLLAKFKTESKEAHRSQPKTLLLFLSINKQYNKTANMEAVHTTPYSSSALNNLRNLHIFYMNSDNITYAAATRRKMAAINSWSRQNCVFAACLQSEAAIGP